MSLSKEEVDKKYNVRPFVDPERTKEDLNPLKLDAIDLSFFEEGDENLNKRQDLANRLEKSITTHGFFNLINHGIPQETIDNLRAVSQSVLTLPYEIQKQYLASAPTKEEEVEGGEGGERGRGFKPKGYWAIKNGIRDSIHHYNFRDSCHDSFVKDKEKHPELVANHLQELADYFNHLQRDILPKLLRLCDLILNIPEGSLQKHYFAKVGTNLDDSNTHGRLMMYEPYGDEQLSQETEGTFLRGHSDMGAFTFITSQPILALQIRDVFTGKWRYIDHLEGSLIVNLGDALEFISGGYFKACLHRVIEPPLDQRKFNRLVIILFCNPSGKAILDPENIQSPKLKQLGLSKEDKLKDWETIQFNDWNQTKGKTLGRVAAGERNLVKFYGRTIERWHHLETIKN